MKLIEQANVKLDDLQAAFDKFGKIVIGDWSPEPVADVGDMVVCNGGEARMMVTHLATREEFKQQREFYGLSMPDRPYVRFYGLEIE